MEFLVRLVRLVVLRNSDVRRVGPVVSWGAYGCQVRLLKSGRVGALELPAGDASLDEALISAAFAETQLLEFSAANCPFDDRHLAQIGSWPKLKRLNLSGTQVTDAGLESLLQLSQLQSLNLQQTAVTPAGVKWLRQRLLNTRILA